MEVCRKSDGIWSYNSTHIKGWFGDCCLKEARREIPSVFGTEDSNGCILMPPDMRTLFIVACIFAGFLLAIVVCGVWVTENDDCENGLRRVRKWKKTPKTTVIYALVHFCFIIMFAVEVFDLDRPVHYRFVERLYFWIGCLFILSFSIVFAVFLLARCLLYGIFIYFHDDDIVDEGLDTSEEDFSPIYGIKNEYYNIVDSFGQFFGVCALVLIYDIVFLVFVLHYDEMDYLNFHLIMIGLGFIHSIQLVFGWLVFPLIYEAIYFVTQSRSMGPTIHRNTKLDLEEKESTPLENEQTPINDSNDRPIIVVV